MGAAMARPPFVGREVELNALARALEFRAERPGLLIGGEAGIGKTRLLDEFSSRIALRGATVTRGGCLRLGTNALPLAPFVEALGRLRESVGDNETIFGGAETRELAMLLPELGRRPPHEPERIRLYEAVRRVFDRVPDPTLLILEDVQWADRSSLELLSYLVRRLRHGRTLVVASLRSDEAVDEAVGAALVELGGSDRAQRLDVAPLAVDALATLVRAVRPEASDETLDWIIGRSEGNPFFAQELAASQWVPGAALPPTLRDLLLLRVRGIGEQARKVLELVAVAGRPVGGILLEIAFEGSSVELDKGLAETVAHGLLSTEPDTTRVALHHELLGDAIRERMSPRERANAHARLAAILSDRPDLGLRTEAGRHGELARHWLAAERMAEALEESVRAAQAAERLPAWAEAHAHYQRALSLWELVPQAASVAGSDHAGLLDRAASVAFVAYEHAGAVVLERAAIAETDERAEPVRLGGMYARLGCWLDAADGRLDFPAAADRALSLIPPEPPTPDRAFALYAAAGSRMETFRYREATAFASEGAAMAAAVGASSSEGLACAIRGFSRFQLGDEERAIADLRGAVSLVAEDLDPYAQLVPHLSLADALTRTADATAAMSALAAFRVVADRFDLQRIWEPYIRGLELEVDFNQGEWNACQRGVDDLLRTEPAAHVVDAARYLRGRIRVQRGQLDDGEADLRAVHASMDLRFNLRGRWAWVGLGELELARGRADRALDVVDAAMGSVVEEGVLPKVHLTVLGLRAAADRLEAATTRNDAGVAREMRARAAEHRIHLDAALSGTLVEGMTVGPTVRALGAWGLAEATRLDRASDPDSWAEAANGLERWIAPHLVPYARSRQAEALLGRGQRRDAGRVLCVAWEQALALGATTVLERVASLARRARLDLSMTPPSPIESTSLDGYGLSPREREVLDLLIEGRTNREIAERLFISDKTASVHVTHILDKLGVPTRGAAAALAARRHSGQQ
jgi:DNA-binding CsgD family transcriptional regulator/tetratricopeptide (TPR) repeat protein